MNGIGLELMGIMVEVGEVESLLGNMLPTGMDELPLGVLRIELASIGLRSGDAPR